MANRRAIGRGLSQAGAMLSDYFMQQEADKNIRRRQAEDDARGAALAGENARGDILKKYLEDRPVTASQLLGVRQANEDAAAPVAETIAKANSLGDAQTEQDVRNQYAMRGGRDTLSSRNFGQGLQSTDNPGGDQQIASLVAQAAAKQKQLTDVANRPNQVVYQANPNGSKTAIGVNPANMPDGGIQTELDAGTQGKLEGEKLLSGQLSPEITAAKAKQEGAVTTAREKAQFPWQQKLAQVRADMAQKEYTDRQNWILNHPKATAQQVNKRDMATAGLGRIQEIRTMADEMEKRGLLGAIQGRWNDLAAGKIKSSDLSGNPDDAKLIADYVTSSKLLSSLVAVTHGGARGGGSVELTKKFESIFNGVGDKAILDGELDSLQRLMQGYADHPDTPQTYDIPALHDETDDLLKQLEFRRANKPMPSHKPGGGL